jgi:molybdate transport system substrate-binding protein
MHLNLLGAGASQGVAMRLAAKLRDMTGCEVQGTYGAVGAMKALLLGGAPCDVVVLSAPLVAELAAGGHVLPDTIADLGVVRTGIAVRSGDPMPAITDAEGLRTTLLEAEGIYYPDPRQATAGIHFAKVIDQFGIRNQVGGRLHTYPNGAAAMRALANADGDRLVGCTQITEINNTPGVALVGRLPRGFDLATTYTAAVCTTATMPEVARLFASLLTADDSRAIRTAAGFEL